MDKDCYAAWLQLLKEPFEKTLLAGKASDLEIMWLLRCTAELAAAWPDTYEQGTPSAAPTVSESSRFSACAHWQVNGVKNVLVSVTVLSGASGIQLYDVPSVVDQVIWDALVRWLSQSEASNSHEAMSARDAAVYALAIMYRKDLARSTASWTSLFRLPVLQQTFPVSTLLIGSRFAKGIASEPSSVCMQIAENSAHAPYGACENLSTFCRLQRRCRGSCSKDITARDGLGRHNLQHVSSSPVLQHCSHP